MHIQGIIADMTSNTLAMHIQGIIADMTSWHEITIAKVSSQETYVSKGILYPALYFA